VKTAQQGGRCRSYTLPDAFLMCVGLGFIPLVLSGCGDAPADGASAPSEISTLAAEPLHRDPDQQIRERGGKVFGQYCAICHGATGAGDGFNSFSLKDPPRNFTDDAFWQTTTRERIVQTIREGGPAVGASVLMPAWGRTLSGTQIDDVAAYLRMLPDIHATALAAEEAEAEAEMEDEAADE